MIFNLRYCRSPGVDSPWSVERKLRHTLRMNLALGGSRGLQPHFPFSLLFFSSFTIMPVHFHVLKTTRMKLPEGQCRCKHPIEEVLQLSGLPSKQVLHRLCTLGKLRQRATREAKDQLLNKRWMRPGTAHRGLGLVASSLAPGQQKFCHDI